MRSRHLRQLGITDDSSMYDRGDKPNLHIFPQPSAAPTALSQLTYLDFVHGLRLVDWAYLLTPTSPPVFAARLTHLALLVQFQDTADVARLLYCLPSMYPSLTRLHVGVDHEGREALSWCVEWEWDAAVQALRTAMGRVWCEEVADVLAGRDDIQHRCIPERSQVPVFPL